MQKQKIATIILLSVSSSLACANSWLEAVYNDLPDEGTVIRYQNGDYMGERRFTTRMGRRGHQPFIYLANCSTPNDDNSVTYPLAVTVMSAHSAAGRQLVGGGPSPTEEILFCPAGAHLPARTISIADLGTRFYGQAKGKSVGKSWSDTLDCDSYTCYLFSTFNKDTGSTEHCYAAAASWPHNVGFSAHALAGTVNGRPSYDVKLDSFTVNGGYAGAAIELDDPKSCPGVAYERWKS